MLYLYLCCDVLYVTSCSIGLGYQKLFTTPTLQIPDPYIYRPKIGHHYVGDVQAQDGAGPSASSMIKLNDNPSKFSVSNLLTES